MNQHISASYTTQLTEPVNIFDADAFRGEVEKIEGVVARADRIAYEMRRTIGLKMEEDPAFYKSFGSLIEETIAAYKQNRLDDADYLERISQQYQDFVSGKSNNLPPQLQSHRLTELREDHARAYYGILQESGVIQDVPYGIDATQLSVEIAIQLEQIIESHKIRDWTHNIDVQRRITNDIEEYLYTIEDKHDIHISGDELDMLLERLIHTARQRDGL